MAETPHLKVGDFIHLNYVKLNSFLTAEGILMDDVYVSNNIQQFEGVLFQIHLQRQYSAAAELELFNERIKDQMSHLTQSVLEKKRGEFVL